MIFWFDRRTASNSLCGAGRFLTNLRDFYPGWRISLRRLCLIPCGRKAISASQARIMFVQSCSRVCAGSTQTDAIKSTLNSGPGGAAAQNSWNTGSLILFSTLMTGSCRRIFSRKGSTRRIGFAPWRATGAFGDRLSLKQSLAASHIVVATYEGVQTIPDKQLAAVGAKRRSCIREPYFGVALQCLPGTDLVLTLTSGMTSAAKRNRDVRLVKAPQELRPFWFLMAWHPRLNSDPPHVWLRDALRQGSSQEVSKQHL